MSGQIKGTQIQPEAIAKANLTIGLQSELDAKESNPVVAEALASPHVAIESYIMVNPPLPVAFVVNLPLGSTHATGRVVVKDKRGMCSIYPITVNPFAGETIEGESSLRIISDHASVSLVFAGTDWSVI